MVALWRPQTLDQFIGQTPIVSDLRVEIEASKRAKRPLRHMVFGGVQGTGKNVLADILAKERGVPEPIKLFGAKLTHEQLSHTLFNLGVTRDQRVPGYDNQGMLRNPDEAMWPILVVDEVEKVPRALVEILHPVLETGLDTRITFMGRHDAKAKSAPMWCVHHTEIWITNYPGELSRLFPAAMSRFPLHFKFQWYKPEELAVVVARIADHAQICLADGVAPLLGTISHGSARIAQQHLEMAHDYAITAGESTITVATVKRMMVTKGYSEDGLTETMLSYLRALAASPTGKMSIDGLVAMMGLGTDQIELTDLVEPILIQRGFLTRTSGGRMITDAGRERIGLGKTSADNPFASRLLN